MSTLLTLLALVTSQAEASPAPPVEEVAISRQENRKRLALSLAGGGGMGGGTFALAPGATIEAGVQLKDRLSLSLRVTGLVLTTWFLGAVAGFDFVLGEHFTLGGGVGAGLFGSSTTTGLNLGVPARLTFAPFTRTAVEIARAGLLIGLELAPAVSFRVYAPRSSVCLQTGCPVSLLGFSGQLTVGYAWW